MKNIVSFSSEKLQALLLQLKASRVDRQSAASFVKKHPKTLIQLLHWALTPKRKRLHQAAAWVLEFVLIEKINWLHPHFDYFLKKLPKISSESSKRPLSKILYYYMRSKTHYDQLSPQQKKKIIALCFDWILLPSKTATLAFAIKILILLQKEYPWIAENLQDYIQNQMPNPSPGLQASIRSIFKK